MRASLFGFLVLVGTPLWLAVDPVTADDEQVGLLVLVAADHAAPPRNVLEVASVYLGAPPTWPDGRAAWPVHADRNSPTYPTFARQVLERELGALEELEQRQLVAGERGAPRLSDIAAIVEHVTGQVDALGYVPCGTRLPPAVQVAFTLGCDTEQDALAETVPVDTTIGDIRLIHIGSCGADGGRRAVVQHRGSYGAVQVKVEVSSWIDEHVQRRRTETFTVSPGEERDLGCTRPSARVGRVLALADVSDASVDRAYAAHTSVESTVARDAVAIDLGASCGRGGRTILASNRDRHRSLRVTLEIETRVEGKMRRRFTKSVQLEPGARVAVGCSADGTLRTLVQVARAAFE